MSRRLGDDPLTRARSKRKAVEGSTPVVLDSGGEQSRTQVGLQTASYNDVFFQRRGEGIAPPQVVADVPASREAPEISEISEIPEIREAAASGDQSASSVTADIKTVSQATRDAQTAPVPPVPTIEAAANLDAGTSGTPSAAGQTTEVRGERASLPASSLALASGGDASKPEAQKSGGFFKRLFGKFK